MGASIVPVVKEDDSVRISGDYKLTVNKVANVDKYRVPKTEDLLLKMDGGRIFCKSDLSNAYHPLVLDRKSKEYLTINTHKGLYQPTRLQFGVHFSVGIFQREMEKRLGHIPRLTVRVDYILIAVPI